MHGTSDFPELLTGASNRTLAAAYQVAQSPLKTLARQSTATDFRAKSVLKLGEFSGLQKVSEHGEIKAMTTGEAKGSYGRVLWDIRALDAAIDALPGGDDSPQAANPWG